MGLGKLRGQHAEVLDNGRIPRHRAFDHVGKHPHYILVKGEVRHLGQGLGEQAIGFLAHGCSGDVGGKAGILAKLKEECAVCLKAIIGSDKTARAR